MQPKTVMWRYLFPLPTTESRFMHNQWCFQSVFLSLWSRLRPYLLSLCARMCTCRQDQGSAYRPSSIPPLCLLFFYTYDIPLPYGEAFHSDNTSKGQTGGAGILKIGWGSNLEAHCVWPHHYFTKKGDLKKWNQVKRKPERENKWL